MGACVCICCVHVHVCMCTVYRCVHMTVGVAYTIRIMGKHHDILGGVVGRKPGGVADYMSRI